MDLILLGLALGGTFGFAARLGRFCLLRGMKGLFGAGEDLSPLRAFALALAVAIIGTQSLDYLGLTDLSQAMALQTPYPWGGLAIGGAIFGLGMVLANACGARSLVLFAGGNLRSLLVILCMGLAAQATLTGVLVPLRQSLQIMVISPDARSLSDLLRHFTGLAPDTARGLAAGGLSVILLGLSARLWRNCPLEALMAVVIGLCVTSGWWAAFALNDPFDPKPLASISFVAPMGESLLWLMLSTGRAMSFGLALVAGVLLGAFAAAILNRSFSFETFTSPSQMIRSGLGGLLMGFGGILAMGCSVGQALSGASTLSLASFIAMAGIVTGIATGLIFLRK